MGDADRRCGIYFDKLEIWQDEARALRTILLDTPLSEAFKWRSPVYTHSAGNVANIAVTRAYCAVGFFKGVLLADPAGILVAPGENSRAMRMAKFTDISAIHAAGATLKDYVAEAIRLEREGRKVDLPKDDFAYPAELVQALDGDADLAQAFEALTPGRKRGWVLHFAGPKQERTRLSRIEKALPRILDGKGLHDR